MTELIMKLIESMISGNALMNYVSNIIIVGSVIIIEAIKRSLKSDGIGKKLPKVFWLGIVMIIGFIKGLIVFILSVNKTIQLLSTEVIGSVAGIVLAYHIYKAIQNAIELFVKARRKTIS